MDRVLKIFIACALGAGIGTAVALQLHPYFWWVGLITGGLVGYFSYEFKAVCRAVPQAWKEVVGWKPDKRKVSALKYAFLLTAALVLDVWLLIQVGVLLYYKGNTWVAISALPYIVLPFYFLVVPWLMFLHLLSELCFKIEKGDKEAEKYLAEIKAMTWHLSPIKLYGYWVPVHSFKSFRFLVIKLPCWFFSTGLPMACSFVNSRQCRNRCFVWWYRRSIKLRNSV